VRLKHGHNSTEFGGVRADKAAVPDSMTSSVPGTVRKNDGDHCAKAKGSAIGLAKGVKARVSAPQRTRQANNAITPK
jgi:hypothetical protein